MRAPFRSGVTASALAGPHSCGSDLTSAFSGCGSISGLLRGGFSGRQDRRAPDGVREEWQLTRLAEAGFPNIQDVQHRQGREFLTPDGRVSVYSLREEAS